SASSSPTAARTPSSSSPSSPSCRPTPPLASSRPPAASRASSRRPSPPPPPPARAGGATLGDTAFAPDARLGTVCLSAHSGGYHAAASCLRAGGVDVRETYLFDALSSDLDVFRGWVLERHGE